MNTNTCVNQLTFTTEPGMILKWADVGGDFLTVYLFEAFLEVADILFYSNQAVDWRWKSSS